jgi:DNA-binding Lrp family transcriptional regulator
MQFSRQSFAIFGYIGGFVQYMTDLDHKSEDILRELLRNGRISNLDLAKRVGLSPSACLRRVQELERRGIIKGYRAVLNRSALGSGFVAYVGVGLRDHSKTSQEAFERTMERTPEVSECHNVTGTIEYLLRVECADLADYKRFHTDKLGALAQVSSITSYVVMGSPKDERA